MNRIAFTLSLVLALLVTVASGAGLLMSWELYAKETADWYAQCIGQDIADLFIALPFLLVSSWLAYHGNRKAHLVHAGVLAYLIYTFTIYCFAVHFNRLFIVYCVTLGLAAYLFGWFVLSQYARRVTISFDKATLAKITGVYLIAIAFMFYVLWLLQVIPANIENIVPKEINDAGLLTNPVHVIDLAICLPGIFITGILLLRKHWFAYLLAPVILTFFVLMDSTICVLLFIAGWKASEGVNIAMLLLALFSSALLIAWLRGMDSKDTASTKRKASAS